MNVSGNRSWDDKIIRCSMGWQTGGCKKVLSKIWFSSFLSGAYDYRDATEQVHVIANESGENTTPSCVCYVGNRQRRVGKVLLTLSLK